MFAEMISQVAAFLKHTPAARELAFEIQFDSLSLRIPYSYGLMPLLRDPVESLVLAPPRAADFIKFLHENFLLFWVVQTFFFNF